MKPAEDITNLLRTGLHKAPTLHIIAGFEIMGLLGLFILAKDLGLIHEVRLFVDKLMIKKLRKH